MTFRTGNTLNLALTAALAARRADILLHLFNSHGPSNFALALGSRPSRQSADVLSMLAPTERTAVSHYLPPEALARLAEAGMTFSDSSACQRKKSSSAWVRNWLLRKSVMADRTLGPSMQPLQAKLATTCTAHPSTAIQSPNTGISA